MVYLSGVPGVAYLEWCTCLARPTGSSSTVKGQGQEARRSVPTAGCWENHLVVEKSYWYISNFTAALKSKLNSFYNSRVHLEITSVLLNILFLLSFLSIQNLPNLPAEATRVLNTLCLRIHVSPCGIPLVFIWYC